MKLMDEFQHQVPNSVSFNIGYFERRQQTKLWLVTNDDLKSMYSKYPEGDVTLWCDGRSADDREEVCECSGRKRGSHTDSKRQEKEDYVDEIYKDLKDKHGEKYDTPKLHLWSRMIASKLICMMIWKNLQIFQHFLASHLKDHGKNLWQMP